MAKLQYFDTMGESSELTDFYVESDLFLVDEGKSETAVDFLDPNGFPEITFKGTGFTYNMDDINTGTLNSIQFFNTDGATLAKLTGLNVDAAATEDAMYVSIGDMMSTLLKGDDKIFGSDVGDYLVFGTNKGNDVIDGGKGRDTLNGGMGKDTMTGGAQSDTFFFQATDGKDVITDFDAVGGGNKQDYLVIPFETKKDIDIIKDGHDVVIKFGDATLTLLDVDRKDFSMDDFGSF